MYNAVSGIRLYCITMFSMMVVLVASATQAQTLLETDFSGTTSTSAALSGITYSMENGLSGPSVLSAASQSPSHSLFTTTDASGYYAPNVQVNGDTWNVDIPLTLTGGDLFVSDIVLSRQHFNSSGGFNTSSETRDYPITVTLTGDAAGEVGQAVIDPPFGTGWGSNAGIETFTFAAPVFLSATDDYTLNFLVNDGSNSLDSGVYVGIGGFAIQGTAAAVPEPTSIAIWLLISLGLVGFGCRGLRRRRGRSAQ